MSQSQPICRPTPAFFGLRTVVSLCLLVLGANQALAQDQKFILMTPLAPAVSNAAALPHQRPRSHAASLAKKQLLVDRFVLSTDQLFEPAKDRFTESGEAKLKALAPSLRALGLHPIVIVAHTDDLGFESYNKELTQHQAQRVKAWIVAHGLAKAAAISAMGAGSSQPLVVNAHGAGKNRGEKKPAEKNVGDAGARNRRIEISIDQSQEVKLEKVAAKVEPVKENNEMTPMALPPELQEGLVDSTMKPCTEEDLTPQFTPTDGQESAHHNVNTAEWGGGGSNFGNNISNFGDGAGTFGGNPVEYNADGKKVVKITPTAEKQEQQRKETVEAQNEFGLWRDR
jgi:outer membrane protein OmpA-like peptidoglycan-associated protein